MRLISLIAVGLVVLCSGCASITGANPDDPLETINRKVDAFNQAIDKAALKPIAQGYKASTPKTVQTGVSNFFGNLKDVGSAINNALQLKPKQTVDSCLRVLINSTVGVLGLIDVASNISIQKHSEDFGQTLGYWGLPAGPYIIIPFLGSSTVRDGLSYFSIDTMADPVHYVDPINARNSVTAIRLLARRASYLSAEEQMGEIALDPYSFLRDFYLQKRKNDVWDGNPPD
ncbi:MAG: VacJ family lipoprotein [Limnohabitans sp.]|nr:VacJ family lipoprotein [Limnohabitans sp.]